MPTSIAEEEPASDDNDDEAAYYRRCFESRAASWAAGRGLIPLLRLLESEVPHALGPACKSLDANAPRPWVPEDSSERQVGLAFRRASRHLHPDRTSTRDFSVRIEAEEYLKILSAAFDNSETWELERTSSSATSPLPSSPPHAAGTRGSDGVVRPGYDGVYSTAAPVDRTQSNADLRDHIFGGMGSSVPQPPPVDRVRSAGSGKDLRDNLFGGEPPVKTRAGRTATAPNPPRHAEAAARTRRDATASVDEGKDAAADAEAEAAGEKKKGMGASFFRRKAKAETSGPPPAAGAAATTPFDEPNRRARAPTVSLNAADALFSSGASAAAAAAPSPANPFDDAQQPAAGAARHSASNPFGDDGPATDVSDNPFGDGVKAAAPAAEPPPPMNPFGGDAAAPSSRPAANPFG